MDAVGGIDFLAWIADCIIYFLNREMYVIVKGRIFPVPQYPRE